MKTLLFVFLGGGMGSILRYGLARLYFMLKPTSGFLVLSTITANFLASFILGLFLTFGLHKGALNDSARGFFIFGLCGGFSTFSTFGLETFRFLKEGNYVLAIVNVLVSVVLSISAIALALKIR